MNRKLRRAEQRQSRPAPSATSINAQDLLAVAVRHHRAGRLIEAEKLYRRILQDPIPKRTPSKSCYADALHLLGVLAHQGGRHDVAVGLIVKAIVVNGNDAAFHNNLGLALQAHGKSAAAAAAIARAVTIRPDYAEAHCNLGNTLQGHGSVDKAVASFERSIICRPDLAEAYSNLGNALKAIGKLGDAVAAYRKALTTRSDYADAYSNLGNALKAQGKLDDAVDAYGRALAFKEDCSEAHCNLGSALQEQGKLDEAVVSYGRAIRLKEGNAEAHYNLGIALKDQGKLNEAVASYERALGHRPHYADAHCNLGLVLKTQGKLNEAVPCYRRALIYKPDLSEAHYNLGITFQEQGRPDEALRCYHRARVLKPDHADTHNNIAVVQQEQGWLDAAVTSLRTALWSKPDFADAHCNLGNLMLFLGRFDEAQRHLATAVELSPDAAVYHYNLAQVKRYTASDPSLDALERLARKMDALPANDQVHVQFALGKAYEDLGAFEQSFRHLLAANALKRRLTCYDETATLALFERIQTVFTGPFMGQRAGMGQSSGVGEPGTGPIFIVGMPRSGTTLVEQILASHRDVYGGGELSLFEPATQDAIGKNAYPEAISRLSSEDCLRIGARCLADLPAKARGAKRITDKTPQNFLFCGLIHLAMPNARIIHVRRNPIDTCLSSFSKLFSDWQPYTYDLAELGRYYRRYETIMEHWRRVLPDGVMIDVQYENVVDDLERQTRRILAHCGLAWDAACLAFHKTERPIRTASATQVRQPIYRSSVGRWRPSPDLLKPLTDELGLT